MTRIERVIETCLYVEDVEASAAWYADVLGLEVVTMEPPRHAFLQAGESMLLLFKPVHTRRTKPTDQSPPHGATGVQHVALAVQDMDAWRERLQAARVEIVEEASFGEGESVYFEDPDGHLVELVSPGTWPVW